MAKVYCPFCKSEKPMMKCGWQLRVGGKPPKQRFQCVNRGCYRITIKPRKSKPQAKLAKK